MLLGETNTAFSRSTHHAVCCCKQRQSQSTDCGARTALNSHYNNNYGFVLPSDWHFVTAIQKMNDQQRSKRLSQKETHNKSDTAGAGCIPQTCLRSYIISMALCKLTIRLCKIRTASPTTHPLPFTSGQNQRISWPIPACNITLLSSRRKDQSPRNLGT